MPAAYHCPSALTIAGLRLVEPLPPELAGLPPLQILAAHLGGESLRSIGRRLGISYGRVTRMAWQGRWMARRRGLLR